MNKFQSQLSQSYENLVEKLGEWLNALILQVPNLIIAIAVATVAYFFSKYVKKGAIKATKRFTDNQTILNLVSNVATVIFGVITIFIMLSILNLDDTINKILATAGVVGLAIGLALQDPMNNLFSGVMLSVRHLYKIGDIVESNGFFGTIDDIDLKTTKIRTFQGQIAIIPNKDVIQKPLKNYSVTGLRRVDLDCGVSYGDDLEKVEQVVLKTLKNLTCADHSQDVKMVYTGFGDSSINFRMMFWINVEQHIDFLDAQSEGVKAIKKAFDNNNIAIPFPIRTIDFGIKGGVALNEMAIQTNSSN